MIALGGARAGIALVGVVLVAGTLAGCSRGTAAAPAPAAVTTTMPTTAPSVPSAGSGSSVQGVQDDLDSANSATSNAGGDVADADRSAATSDSP